MEKKKLNIPLEDNMLDCSLENNSSNTWELLSELKENSDATRREIEGLTDLITLKDNQIKDAEDKLSELEIKMTIYKERENIYKDRIKDKNDLIAALSLDSTYMKAKFDNFVELFSTIKDKITISENQPNIKDINDQIAIMKSKLKEKEDHVALMEPKIKEKDEQIKMTESKIKERDDQVALMEIKIKERDGQIKMLESRLKQRDDQVAFMEPKIKEKNDQITILEYKVKEKENQVALMETKNKEIDDQIKVLELNIEEDETIEPFTLYTKEMNFPGLDPFKLAIVVGSAWCVIHCRINGDVSFDRGLDDYINGFGDPNEEYWLGLERIHKMTIYRRHELTINMHDYNNKNYYARYDNFVVGSKDENYKLKILGSHKGSAGDMMRHYVNIPYFMYSGKGSHCPKPLRLNFNGKLSESQINNSDYLYWGEEPNRMYIKKVWMTIRLY